MYYLVKLMMTAPNYSIIILSGEGKRLKVVMRKSLNVCVKGGVIVFFSALFQLPPPPLTFSEIQYIQVNLK